MQQVVTMPVERQSHAQLALRSERINQLVSALSEGVYEREHTIKLCLLAALSGESVFLLGPPGIAKSLIAKRLIQAFEDSSYFEYLMTRFSTPEEVFGPLSIQELKDNGRYVRLTQGYLPTAKVVFLDEIWKAGPAILNTLLTVVNEKTFKNGADIEQVPMRLLISASNELPEQDSGLEALYDRMLVRVFVNRIQNKQNFRSMLTVGTPQEAVMPAGLAITNKEYHQWQSELDTIELSEGIFEKLYQLKLLLEARMDRVQDKTIAQDLYVSDRRWKKSVRLLKASAFFCGRKTINPLDLVLIQDCLWNSPESRKIVREVIENFAIRVAFDQQIIREKLEELQQTISDIQIDVESAFSLELKFESGTGLLAKDSFYCDVPDLKRFKVGRIEGLVKLAILQPNLSVHEQDKGDSRWVYVAEKDLKEVISAGGKEVYGYVNENPNLCQLTFSLDADDRLVIKDIANRAVLVAPVAREVDLDQLASWSGSSQKALAEFEALKHQLLKAKSNFHSALPHNFIEPELPAAMENGLISLTRALENAQQKMEKQAFRIRSLPEIFGE
ncbi:ATPase RavA domain-containing protein [Vibrio sp. qd031]|uniref:ATPase RavA domain-containing protein n=1 Tax=Vibrio sp. qd031 TaxID=1603038 RepID=UPI001F5B0A7B|nr:ATPase RavA domain-containing protein [Vibrio sp. qd031]